MTIGSVAQDARACRNKLGGLDRKSHAAARELQKLLEAMDAARSGLPADLARRFEPVQTDVNRLIEKVISLQTEIKGGNIRVANMTRLVAEMAKAKGTSELERILKGTETASEIALATKGWVTFSGDAGKIATGIVKDAVTVGRNIDRWMDDVKELMA